MKEMMNEDKLVKPGLLTTEFWAALMALLGGTHGMQHADWRVASTSVVGVAAIVIAYMWSRTRVKERAL